MSKPCQRVTRISLTVSTVGTVVYVLAILLAASDGAGRGVEIRLEVTGLALVVISLCGVIASVGWLIDRASTAQAEYIAAAVSEALVGELDTRITRAATRAGNRTVKLINESITGELMVDNLNAAVNRAYRYGELAANNVGRASVPDGANGQPWPTHPGAHTNGSVSTLRRRG